MPSRPSTGKKVSARPSPPKLLPVSEDMKAWSSMLGEELKSWPGVSLRPMFGLISFYRGSAIFAALPRSRALHSSSAFILKLHDQDSCRARITADPRIVERGEGLGVIGRNWLAFEIRSEQDLHDALVWLQLAYEKAA